MAQSRGVKYFYFSEIFWSILFRPKRSCCCASHDIITI